MHDATGTMSGVRVPRRDIMNSLGSVIYVARMGDGTIKIGHTNRFGERMRWLKSEQRMDASLIAFRLGTYAEEQQLHKALVGSRTKNGHETAREFYDPTPEVMAVVNSMRAVLGLGDLRN